MLDISSSLILPPNAEDNISVSIVTKSSKSIAVSLLSSSKRLLLKTFISSFANCFFTISDSEALAIIYSVNCFV